MMLRNSVVYFLILIILLNNHYFAFADNEPLLNKAQKIEACLLEKTDIIARFKCIGIQSNKCLDENPSPAEIDTRNCLSNEWQAWDYLLNNYYNYSNSIFSKKNNQYLKQAQIKWISLRKENCSWPYEVYPGGSLQSSLSARCFMIQTALRTIDLLEIKERLSER